MPPKRSMKGSANKCVKKRCAIRKATTSKRSKFDHFEENASWDIVAQCHILTPMVQADPENPLVGSVKRIVGTMIVYIRAHETLVCISSTTEHVARSKVILYILDVEQSESYLWSKLMSKLC